ncbi:hypothetical protein IWX90DRAFT_59302 [Phyllosticta citrichinensis]|uniref:Uncharacterized protein n=1 Tax=Phyllosticta citrichinensis TaxID=1130410 RepID=A0ABR1XH38_9PEZI
MQAYGYFLPRRRRRTISVISTISQSLSQSTSPTEDFRRMSFASSTTGSSTCARSSQGSFSSSWFPGSSSPHSFPGSFSPTSFPCSSSPHSFPGPFPPYLCPGPSPSGVCSRRADATFSRSGKSPSSRNKLSNSRSFSSKVTPFYSSAWRSVTFSSLERQFVTFRNASV